MHPRIAHSSRVPKDKRALTPIEASVSDVIGRLMEFWGFKRNMGRVWAVLYLSSEPQSAEDLRQMLKLSSGAVVHDAFGARHAGESCEKCGSKASARTSMRRRCSFGG